jgi:hypothetical protein
VSLGGDLNQLPDTLVIDSTGLPSLVKEPTRGPGFLDRLYSSDINYNNIKVLTSSVKSDHKCILANSGDSIKCSAKTRRSCSFRPHTPNQNALFLLHGQSDNFTFSSIGSSNDVQEEFNIFYDGLLTLLDKFFPMKTITLTDRDPPYVTPNIKFLLKRKNKLMHQNKTDEAGALAIRIGKEITKFNASSLKSCNHKNASADMWDKVRHLLNKSHSSTDVVDKSITAVSLNQHFTNISSDPKLHFTLYKINGFLPR